MAATVEGVLDIDKPPGRTSHNIVNEVRKLSGIRRVGHTGTLDPLATGLLVLCLGRATRLAEYLAGQRKMYEATIRLGQETDTYDAMGKVIAEKPTAVTRQELDFALDRFRGDINQVPPTFSAIKQEGQPLYKYARQGMKVDPPIRKVTIYELALLWWRAPELRLRITCSSGTYVRSIAHDLGQALGCGGHVAALRRTAVGHHSVKNAVSLDELHQGRLQDYLQPTDTAVRHLPELVLSADDATRLYHGQRVPRRAGQTDASLVCAYDRDGRFVGVIAREQREWRARKIFYHPET